MLKKIFFMLLFPLTFSLIFSSHVKYISVDTYQDFLEGKKIDNISVSFEGRMYLSHGLKEFSSVETPVLTCALFDKSGNLFVSSAGDGKIYKITPDGKSKLFYKSSDKNIFAMTILSDGTLVAGASPSGKVIFISADGKSVKEIETSARYIWKILASPDGRIYVSTGMPGKIFKIENDKAHEIFNSKENHITAMAFDRDGNILFGVSNGGIYKLNVSNEEVISIFDTGIKEIRDIKIDSDGIIYILTTKGKKKTFSLNSKNKLELSLSEVLNKAKRSEKKNGGSVSPIAKNNKMKGKISLLYKIDRNYDTTILWSSKSEIGFSLLIGDDNSILISTLSGRIYKIDTLEYTTLLSEKKDAEFTGLLNYNKNLYVISSNPGKIFLLNKTTPLKGEYFSKIFDTKFLSKPGTVSIDKNGKFLKCEYFLRGGNVKEPDDTWSAWQKVEDFKKPARYFQVKLILKNLSKTKLDTSENYVESFYFSYLPMNQKPILKGVFVNPPDIIFSRPITMNQGKIVPDFGKFSTLNMPGYIMNFLNIPQMPASRKLFYPGSYSLYWVSSDPDGDNLTYTVFFRSEKDDDWELFRKDIKYNFINIMKGELKDNIYFFKIVASDKNSTEAKPAKTDFIITKKVVIDTTGPEIKFNEVKNTLNVSVKDALSTIYGAEYRFSDEKMWRKILPVDGISDEKEETYKIKLQPNETGKVIIFRALDYSGNLNVNKFKVK